MASEGLISFAEKNGLYDPKQGKFDFHEAYSHDCKDADRDDFTYNYPRVWGIQKLLSPSIKNDVARNTFPVFAKADKEISLQTLRNAFRFHYDGTAHDPYLHNNGKEPYRPVSIFRTTQTHIIQVRPNLPQAIGHITYVALGMADLGVFLPLYQGVKHVPEAYTRGRNTADHESAYWKFRKVMTLGMVNYNAYAPIIKDRYAQLEIENDRLQHDFETQYLVIYKDNPQRANTMLQQFSDHLLHRALDVADQLLNDLFTQMTLDTQKEYLFHGA